MRFAVGRRGALGEGGGNHPTTNSYRRGRLGALRVAVIRVIRAIRGVKGDGGWRR